MAGRRQMDLSTFRPRDIELTFGCDDDDRPIHPDPDNPAEPRVFVVRGRFTADEMLEMLAITERVDQIKESEGTEGAKELLAAVSDVARLVSSLIGERYPGVDLPPLSIEQALMLLTFLVGDVPAAAVADALMAGAPEMSEAEQQTRAEEILDKLERGDTLDPPTRSGSDSSSPSSTSETSTAGDPNGGRVSPGASSAPISSGLIAV